MDRSRYRVAISHARSGRLFHFEDSLPEFDSAIEGSLCLERVSLASSPCACALEGNTERSTSTEVDMVINDLNADLS